MTTKRYGKISDLPGWMTAGIVKPKSRKLTITIQDSVLIYGEMLEWSGGSRSQCWLLWPDKKEVAAQLTSDVSEYQFPMNSHQAVLEHRFFNGKDMGLHLYCDEELADSILPDPTLAKMHLAWAHKVVLCATKSYRSGYRIDNAMRETGITQDEWQEAAHDLIAWGYLDGRGALTLKGKNAAPNVWLHSLERPQGFVMTKQPTIPEWQHGNW